MDQPNTQSQSPSLSQSFSQSLSPNFCYSPGRPAPVLTLTLTQASPSPSASASASAPAPETVPVETPATPATVDPLPVSLPVPTAAPTPAPAPSSTSTSTPTPTTPAPAPVPSSAPVPVPVPASVPATPNTPPATAVAPATPIPSPSPSPSPSSYLALAAAPSLTASPAPAPVGPRIISYPTTPNVFSQPDIDNVLILSIFNVKGENVKLSPVNYLKAHYQAKGQNVLIVDGNPQTSITVRLLTDKANGNEDRNNLHLTNSNSNNNSPFLPKGQVSSVSDSKYHDKAIKDNSLLKVLESSYNKESPFSMDKGNDPEPLDLTLYPKPQGLGNVYLIPGDIHLHDCPEDFRALHNDPLKMSHFSRMIRKVAKKKNCRVVLLDLPSSINEVNSFLVMSSDAIMISSSPDNYSIQILRHFFNEDFPSWIEDFRNIQNASKNKNTNQLVKKTIPMILPILLLNDSFQDRQESIDSNIQALELSLLGKSTNENIVNDDDVPPIVQKLCYPFGKNAVEEMVIRLIPKVEDNLSLETLLEQADVSVHIENRFRGLVNALNEFYQLWMNNSDRRACFDSLSQLFSSANENINPNSNDNNGNNNTRNRSSRDTPLRPTVLRENNKRNASVTFESDEQINDIIRPHTLRTSGGGSASGSGSVYNKNKPKNNDDSLPAKRTKLSSNGGNLTNNRHVNQSKRINQNQSDRILTDIPLSNNNNLNNIPPGENNNKNNNKDEVIIIHDAVESGSDSDVEKENHHRDKNRHILDNNNNEDTNEYDLTNLTRDELRARLISKGIPYKSKDRKEQLLERLLAHEYEDEYFSDEDDDIYMDNTTSRRRSSGYRTTNYMDTHSITHDNNNHNDNGLLNNEVRRSNRERKPTDPSVLRR